MDFKVKHKKVPLLTRISTSVNQEKLTKTMEEPRSLLERMSVREPSLLSRMNPQQTSSNIQPDGSDLNSESLIDNYRDGRKTKTAVIEAVKRELERDPPLTDEEKESAHRLYLKEIDSAEARVERGLPSTE